MCVTNQPFFLGGGGLPGSCPLAQGMTRGAELQNASTARDNAEEVSSHIPRGSRCGCGPSCPKREPLLTAPDLSQSAQLPGLLEAFQGALGSGRATARLPDGGERLGTPPHPPNKPTSNMCRGTGARPSKSIR